MFKVNKRDVLEIMITAFFGVTINISAFFLGLQKTESINAPVIASAGPVVIYFLSLIFLKEKAKLKVLVGMLFALMGVLLIILSPIFMDGKKLALGQIEGNLFLVLAMLGGVLYTVINKDLLKRISPVFINAVSFLIGAVTFLPFMIKEHQTWNFTMLNGAGLFGIVFGVFLCSALAYYLFNYAVSKLSAQEVGIFTYLDPVAAVVLAIPLLHEYPNIYFVMGSVFVFLGIYFAERRIPWHPLHKIRSKSDKI